MMKDFRTFQQAKALYQAAKTAGLKGEVKDQLLRAALSVCLNLAEGDAKSSQKDRKRFFNIALASLREVQAIVELENLIQLSDLADRVGACLFKLCKSL